MLSKSSGSLYVILPKSNENALYSNNQILQEIYFPAQAAVLPIHADVFKLCLGGF